MRLGVTVCLEPTASAEEIERAGDDLRGPAGVVSVAYLDKEASLARGRRAVERSGAV